MNPKHIPFVCALSSSLHFLPSLPHPICFAPSPSLMIPSSRPESERGERKGRGRVRMFFVLRSQPRHAPNGKRKPSNIRSPPPSVYRDLSFIQLLPQRSLETKVGIFHPDPVSCPPSPSHQMQAMLSSSHAPPFLLPMVLALLLRIMHVPEVKSVRSEDNQIPFEQDFPIN